MAKWKINDQYWKIWRGSLRPAISSVQAMEIQTKTSGITVIPWSAFDDSARSITERLAIARRIVRLHNEDLNRQRNRV
jgi:hypothetical protein